MTTAHDLPEGMYLVGRVDGSVSSLFVRITTDDLGRFYEANVSSAFLDSIINHPTQWWWHPKTPETLPSETQLSAMPSMRSHLP